MEGNELNEAQQGQNNQQRQQQQAIATFGDADDVSDVTVPEPGAPGPSKKRKRPAVIDDGEEDGVEAVAKLDLDSAVGCLREIDFFAYEDHGEDAWMYGYVVFLMRVSIQR